MLRIPPSDLPMHCDDRTIIPAATVIIFRHSRTNGSPELLMVQRSNEMRFAGGAAVFPGGRVDPADHELARRILPDDPPEMGAARIAAIRETLEETGLMVATRQPIAAAEVASARKLLLASGRLETVIDHYSWELVPSDLTLFAHWCPLMERAFDTRFFITDLGTGAVDIEVDSTENTHLFWASAVEALKMADRGEISVIYPTHRNLERLAQFEDYGAALSDIANYPVERVIPTTEDRDDGQWLVIDKRHGYPVCSQNMTSARRG